MQQLPPGFVIDDQPQQGGNTIITKRANPTEKRGDVLKNQLTEAQIQKLIIDMNKPDKADKPNLPTGYRMKADGSGAELIPGVAAPGSNASGKTDKAGAYNSVINQIDRLYQLYNEGIGQTTGIESLLDYLPTTSNEVFDTAGAALGDQGNAAFKVPGMGAQSDADAARFVAANQPQASDKDKAALEKLRAIRQRLESNMGAVGLPAPQWNYDLEGRAIDPQQRQSAPQQQDMPAGNLPQQGVDQSTQWLGAPSPNQPGGFVPYGQQYKTVDNPALAGLNARINGMLKAGASREQIAEYMQSMGVNPNDPEIAGGLNAISQFRVKNPQYKGGYNVNLDDMVQPLSGGFMGEQFRNDAPQTMAGTAAATALNAGGMGLPQMMAGDEGFDHLRSQNPTSAFVGDVTGVIGGTSAIGSLGRNTIGKALPQLLGGGGKSAFGRQLATDATYGGIYGATTEGDPVGGALTAAAGSVGGQALGKGLQKTFQGVTDPAVQYLTQRGVPLTIGQTLGNRGMIGKTMNKLESLPLVGDMMNARRVEGLQAFEREALNDVVAPIGGRVSQGGPDGLSAAQQQVGDAYTNALSGVNIPGDPQFIQEAGAALAKGRQIPTMGDQFDYGMQQRIGTLFEGGQLSGPEFQAATQNLRGMKGDFAKEGAMGNFAADAVGDMDTALQGLVGRQAPDVMPQYNAANEAYSGLAPFQNARISGINQPAISPAQLGRAITSNTKKYGGTAAAARGQNLTDLVKYGQEVLPSTVPDSGTGGRIAAMLLPTALGGSAVSTGTLTDSPGITSTLAILAAMSSKTGAKALQKALTSRPDAVRKAGGLFGSRKARQALSGAVTAPFLIE